MRKRRQIPVNFKHLLQLPRGEETQSRYRYGFAVIS